MDQSNSPLPGPSVDSQPESVHSDTDGFLKRLPTNRRKRMRNWWYVIGLIWLGSVCADVFWRIVLHPTAKPSAIKLHGVIDTWVDELMQGKPFRKPTNVRVVALVLFSSRRKLSMLHCYLQQNLATNGGILQSVVFIPETGKEKDLDWLLLLANSEPSYQVELRPGVNPAQHISGINLAWQHVEPETLYIHISSEIVFLEPTTIPLLIETRLKELDYSVISANIINQPTLSWIHHHLGVLLPYKPEMKPVFRPINASAPPRYDWRASELPTWDGPKDFGVPLDFGIPTDFEPPFNGHRWLPLRTNDTEASPLTHLALDVNGPGRWSWTTGALHHYSFLERLERRQLHKYKFAMWDFQHEIITPSMFVMWGRDIVNVRPMPMQGPDKWLSRDVPRKLDGRYPLVDGRALAVHFAHDQQSSKLPTTDLLERYKAYADENKMKEAFLWARFLPLRSSCTAVRTLPFRQRYYTQLKSNRRIWQGKAHPGRKGGRLLICAALSPAAFLKITEEENHEGKTSEEQMLEASRAEIKKGISKESRGLRRLLEGIVFAFDKFIYEPVATGFRFLHLVVIFVPVIVTVPVIWFGTRVKDRDNERKGTLWWYGFLVKSMERAGPAFIKLGQWAASRTDIFPNEMCSRMSSLHSNAPAHSLEMTKRTLEVAFERPFEDIFEEFQEKPLGVGAIAQVYKAKLKRDLAAPGPSVDSEEQPTLRKMVRKNVDALVKSTPERVPSSYVAIKVLHPHVERIVRRDLRIMGFFASAINLIPTMHWLSLPDEVSQFGEMMRLQLDLRIECANLTIFRKHFKDRTTAWFPYPYTDYTTRQVLVEEFAQGIPLEAFLQHGGGSFDAEIAGEGLDAFLHMLLIDNFVHADLHPGNIMVRFYHSARPELPYSSKHNKDVNSPPTADETDETESILSRLRPHLESHDRQAWHDALAQIDAEGYRPQLIFIDTGLVTELNAVNRQNFLDLFRAIAEFNGYKAGQLMIERCRQPEAVIDGEVFALKMQHLVLAIKGQTFALGNIKIGDVLSEVLSMVRSHHVRMEGDFVNVVISILLLEGIGRTLDPNLDLFKEALPILRQLGSGAGAAGVINAAKEGDWSFLKIWVGLEARRWLKASTESVEMCVKYDQLSPNI